MIFSMPTSSRRASSRARRTCRTSPGRTGSAASTRIRRISSAQFAVEPESYLRMYPEIVLTPDERKAFLDDRTGCIVGDGLAKKYGFKVGDRIDAAGRHPDLRHRRTSTSRSAASTRPSGAAVDNQSMMFHWKYADERSIAKGQIGWFVIEDRQPRSRGAGRRRRSTEVRQLAVRDQDRDRAGVLGVVRLDARQPEPAARQRRARRRASRRCSSPATRWRCRCASGRPRLP